MPAALSRKRGIDAVVVSPEKRRRTSGKVAPPSPQESLRIEVRREQGGGCDWDVPSLTPVERIQCVARLLVGQGVIAREVHIAQCHSLFIERPWLQRDFQARMKRHAIDAASLASSLFDEAGNLKLEIAEHGLKSGSRLWNHELSNGDILVLGKVEVSRNLPCKDIASMLVDRTLQEVSSLRRRPFFAFASTSQIPEVVHDQHMDVVDAEGRAIKNTNETSPNVKELEAFWRAQGFRRVGISPWFAWSSDPDHPARHSSALADFNLSARHFFSEHNQHSLVHTDILQELPDGDCLGLFLETVDLSTDDLRRIDGNGNTLFHLAAVSSKPMLIFWLRIICPSEVISWRNFERETPLETLLSARQMKRRRLEQQGIAHSGHDNASLLCQHHLSDDRNLSIDRIMRWKFDCTCMHCLDGVLSPRTRVKLIAAAMMSLRPTNDSEIEFKTFIARMMVDFNNFAPIVESDALQLFHLVVQRIAAFLESGDSSTEQTLFEILGLQASFSQTATKLIQNTRIVRSALEVVIKIASMLTDHEVKERLPPNPKSFLEETPKCLNDDRWERVRRYLLTAEVIRGITGCIVDEAQM
ncbi:MAG: hypothetical protein M1822_002980 [Bathelium mastoideum]|nr:MAG: hypothetical protein M1822_002980 [Bathelium mastoideum]